MAGPKSDMTITRIARPCGNTLLQAAEKPIELSAAEQARQHAIDSGDMKAASHAEFQIVVALLRSQFGAVNIDRAAGIIFLQVGRQFSFLNSPTKELQTLCHNIA